ncbi:MAG: hypothetical protein ACI8S6_000927 [Myxococcota bacterium]|jgi:hypothetical protein
MKYAATALSLMMLGCGDYVNATGELGQLSYGLSIDYEMEGDLTEVSLVTGHPQSINVALTDEGEKSAAEPWRITHTITPSDGVTLTVDEGEEGESYPPDLVLSVPEAGDYTVESYYGDELLDYISLRFDRPDVIKVQTWIREPNADDFEESTFDETLSVTEGTQVAFLPIPYSGSTRLAGDYAVSYSHTPEEAAVTIHNVYGTYEEEGVIGAVSSSSLVFIAPEQVIVTIRDEANNLDAQRTFNVTPQ